MYRHVLTALALCSLSAPAVAQETKQEKGSVMIPSDLELTEEQQGELQRSVIKEVEKALEKCVSSYPRPEFFSSVVLDYTLKKSGRLTGGYVGGAAPDPSLYVKDDAEREKLETEGAFARLTVRNDRTLERCMKKSTGEVDSGLQRFSAAVSAAFDVAWSGKKATVTPTKFEIERTR